MIGCVSWSKAELASRIEEIVVDAYCDDEQLGSFECMLDELLDRPVAAMVIGEPVDLVSVRAEGAHVGLRARCRRNGRSVEVALLDVVLAPGVDGELALTIAAYRSWAGYAK